MPTCVSAEIIPPKSWGDMARVKCTMSDNSVYEWRYFDDEISFSQSELVGLTKGEIDTLRSSKDMAYIQS